MKDIVRRRDIQLHSIICYNGLLKVNQSFQMNLKGFFGLIAPVIDGGHAPHFCKNIFQIFGDLSTFAHAKYILNGKENV